MAKSDIDVVQLMVKMLTHETGSISKVDFVPQKIAFPEEDPAETHLEKSSPESQGISSGYITEMLNELYNDPECNMHKVMMVRNGKIISETGFAPYKSDTWHITHSMCKTLTGMAIGLLVDDGRLKLTDRVVDIFGSKGHIFSSLRLKDLTVWNLLTMTSGVQFNETGIISGNHWRKGFLESGTGFNPGAKFEYNSMNSYMLSAIVTEITGQSMFDFIKPAILDPLGIKRIFWESCPEKITKGGWGLFMRAEDMAKLGLLYMQKGQWNGQQILSTDWVNSATMAQTETGIEGSPRYGFQLWVGNNRLGEYTFNGMLGQNVYCYPDINVVLVTNAGNSEVFQKGHMTDIIRKYMGNIKVSDSPLPKNIAAESILRHTSDVIGGDTASLPVITGGGWNRSRVKPSTQRIGNQFEKMWKECLSGSRYETDIKGIGLFPLMMQVFHNNFTDGITDIGFHMHGGKFYMEIHEGSDMYQIGCGIGDRYERSSIVMHGETYQIAVKSVFTMDEYDRMVIRNDIFYPEEATYRMMNIYFGKIGRNEIRLNSSPKLCPPEDIEIRMDETPGSDMMIESLRSITTDSRIEALLMSKLAENGIMGALDETIRYTVKPIVRGKLIH